MPYENVLVPDRRFRLECARCGAEDQEIRMRVCWECSRIICLDCTDELPFVVTCLDCLQPEWNDWEVPDDGVDN